MNEIIDAIEYGTRFTDLTNTNLEEHFKKIIKNLKYLGIDFDFFDDTNIGSSFVYNLKRKFNYITDKELTIIMTKGCSGGFSKQPQNLKGYHVFSWINEYIEGERRKVLQNKRDAFDEDRDHRKYDTSNSPVGKAIIWKMDNIKIKDWETIPLQEISQEIKEKGTARRLLEKYDVEPKQ